jgi:HD-GYP domain-containing protein (c-di-GMP phosphodiesterase class II)
VGVDDVAFHRWLFALDRVTPASVASLLWQLQGRQTDSATSRVMGWTRSVFGMLHYQHQVSRRGVEAARLAEMLSCPVATASTLTATLEHWDGSGYPNRSARDRIPITARIVAAAQLATIWGEEAAPAEVAEHLGRQVSTRLDPAVVRIVQGVLGQGLPPEPATWLDTLVADLGRLDPPPLSGRPVSVATVAHAFAEIVDAKSPFTASHSQRVAGLAGAMARLAAAAWDGEEIVLAGLLHDLGKLAVPNLILDKAGPLDDDEWAVLRRHPADSVRVMREVPGWGRLATWAGGHHERPDGRGYHQGLRGDEIAPASHLLAAADAFDAMTADRPYRHGMPVEEALRRLRAGRATQFDPHAIELLEAVVTTATHEDLRATA